MKARKRKIRELAMQVLFVWDAHGTPDPEMAREVTKTGSDDPVLRDAAVKMATGAWGQRDLIDPRLERHAPQWPVRRQPGVDRSLLRLAVYELTNEPTPPKVVIDEAMELSKEFSTAQSAPFINAVLDAILKEHRALTSEAPALGVEALSENPTEPLPAPDAPPHDAPPAPEPPPQP